MRRFRLPFRLESLARGTGIALRSGRGALLGVVRAVVRLRLAATLLLVMLAGAWWVSGIALSAGQHRRTELATRRQKPIPPPPLSFFRRADHTVGLSARQRRQAVLSRTAYRDLDAAGALKLARRPAGALGLAASSFYQPLMLRKGERVVRFINAHEALVREPAPRRTRKHPSAQTARVLTAQSMLPMTVGKGSHQRPVSLALKRVGSALAPVTPLVPLTISPDRVRFTNLGVSLTLEGAHPSVLDDLGRESFESSVFRDTDLVQQPLAVGAEQWLQLRSPAAPERFRFALTLPAGASARISDGSVTIDQGKATLLTIPAASATDALRRPVSARYSLAGSTLILTVSHRQNRQITYPIAVDPIEVGTPCYLPHVQDPYNFIASECGLGTTGFENTGANNTPDLWEQWNFYQTGAAFSHFVGSGIYVYGTPGTYYPAGSFAEYIYTAPSGAFIQRVDFENTEHSNSGAVGSSFYWEGIFDNIAKNWEPETVNNGLGGVVYLGANPLTQPELDGGGDHFLYVGTGTIPQNPEMFGPASDLNGTNGNAAVFGLVMGTSGVRPSSALDLAYMQGATIWLYDFNPPTITSSPPPSSFEWTDDGDQAYSLSPSATETGLGIKYLSLTSVNQTTGAITGLGSQTNPCTGDHTGTGYCPTSVGVNDLNLYGWDIPSMTYQLPEGNQQVTLTATSALGFFSKQTFPEKIDRYPATATLNGSLYAARVGNAGGSSQANPLPGSSYPLQINASDTASGVAEVDVSVDNGTPTVFHGNCTPGTAQGSGCDQAATFNYTFQSDDYPAGEHTITVTAKDCLAADLPGSSPVTNVCGSTPLSSHQTTQSFEVWTQPSASLTSATAPTPAQNDTLGLENFYDYRTVQTGAGSTANVNLATGNLAWNDIPMTDPGQGLSSFVEVTYNSQQRLSDLNLITSLVNGLPVGQLLGGGYDQIGQGFSIGIDGLTRLNEPLDLSQEANGQISFTDIDGTHHTFVYSPSTGQWVAPPGVFLHLRQWDAPPYTAGTNGTWNKAWAITRPDGVTFFFDGLGYESSIEDRTGNTINFQRNYVALGAASGSVAAGLCTGSSTAGVLTTITTLLGAGCTEQVTAVVDQNNTTGTNSQGQLTNTRALSIAYNGSNLISSITDHAGHTLAFSYTNSNNSQNLVSMTASSGGAMPREFQFGYGGTDGGTDAVPPLSLPALGSIPVLSGLLGTVSQLTGIDPFQQGLTSITDPNVSASGQGRSTTISYAINDGAATTTCPEPTSSTSPLSGLLNLEPKCVTQIEARDGGTTGFTYNDQAPAQGQQPNPGCAAGALECTLVTGPQADQSGGQEKWTDSFDSAFRAFQQVDPLGRETLTTWNNPTTGASGGICSTAQSASGCESGPGNTIAGTTTGMIVPGYATDPSATSTPSPATTLFSYDPNGDTTEQQGPANLAAGESQTFRDTKTFYQESPGTLLAPSGADQGGQFVADETSQQVQSASGIETTQYTLDPSDPDDGLVTAVTDPDGQTWKTDYYSGPDGISDGDGLIKDEVDPLGNTTYYGNALGQYGSSSSLSQNNGYDPNGLPELVYAPGQTTTPTTSQYDADGNLIAKTDPRNTSPTWLNQTDPTSTNVTAPFTTYYAYNDLNEQTDEWIPKNSQDGVFIHQSTAYDANGNVASQTDGNRNTTTYTYTAMDQVATKSSPAVQDAGETAPAPEVTSYCYDLNGDQTYQVLPAGQPWSCGSSTPPANHASETIYDADGEPLVQEQFSTTPGTQDQLTSSAYDARGNQVGTADAADNAGATPAVAETNAASASAVPLTAGPWRTRTVYDSANNAIEVDTNPSASNGAIYQTLSQYDAAGNLVATESAKEADSKTANAAQSINASTGEYAFAGESGMTTYTYNARNLLTGETDPDGGLTEYARQADGKICAVISPDGTALSTPTTDDCTTAGSYKTMYSYYPEGWLAQIGLPTAPEEYAYSAPLQVSYARDLVGNPTTITDPDGNPITNKFYDTGDLETTSAPWWWTYDPKGTTAGPDPNTGGTGQVASDTPGAGLQIAQKTLQEIYQDDASSSSTPSLPADGTSGSFGDVPAQQLPGILPSAGETSFAYDNDMNLQTVTDAEGQGAAGTTTLSYDPVGRLTELQQPYDGTSSSTTTYTHDQDGNVVSTTTPAVATLTSPNATTAAQLIPQTTTNTYDGLDRLASTTAPGASASQGSPSGNPFTNVPTQTTTYCYYLAPVQGTAPVGSGVSSCPQAPSGGAPATVTAPGGVSYQVAERVQVIDPGDNASDLDYDTLGNELASTDPLGNMTSYAYDELGDQTAVVRPSGQNGTAGPEAAYTTTSSYDVAGRLTSNMDGSGNKTSYTYDPDGNMLTESQPGAASAQGGSAPAQVMSYTYNGRGLQWSVTTGTGSDARTTVTETDGDGNPIRTVNPAGVGANGSPYYPYVTATNPQYNSMPSLSSTDPDEGNADANIDATIRVYDASNMLRAAYLPWGCNQTANTTKASCVPQAPASGQAFNVATNDDTRRFAETFTPSSDGMDWVGSVTQAYDWTNTDLPPGGTSPKYTTAYNYFPNGWIMTAADPQLDDGSQQTTTYKYDPAGDQTSENTTGMPGKSGTQLGRSSTRSYWPDGQPQQVDGQAQTALAHRYNYYYEPTGQLSELDAIPTGDGSGAPANETDSMCYDAAGRQTQVNQTFSPEVDGESGFDTVQTYDADGNVTTSSTNGTLTGGGCPTATQSSTPPTDYSGGQQTTNGYNSLDEETSMSVQSTPGTTPTQPTRTYTTTYWPSGQKKTQTRQQAGGSPISEQWYYNDNGQESEDVNSSESKDQLYSYDTDGNLTGSENGTHLDNALDQEVQWTRGGPNTAYSGSTVDYLHDGTGALLEQIANTTQLNISFMGASVNDTTEQTTRYCSSNTATSTSGMTAAQAAAPPWCSLDAGRVENTNTTTTSTTTATVLGITGTAKTTSGSTIVYSCYDALGDVTETVGSGNTCTTSSPNVTSTTAYTYNSFGQLRQSIAPDPGLLTPDQTVTDSYLYDALGRRFEKAESLAGGLDNTTATTNYGYLGLTDEVTQDTDINTSGTHYTNTYDYDSSGNPVGFDTTSSSGTGNGYYSYATDSQGSIEGLEGSNGTTTPNDATVSDEYHYTPYGDLELGSDQGASLLSTANTDTALSQEAQANDFLYEAFQYDPGTNSYALPAREYTPATGGYLTPDTFESSTAAQDLQTNLDTQNPYTYAAGNPTTLIETDGHTVCDPDEQCHGSGAVTYIANPNGTGKPTGVYTNDQPVAPPVLKAEDEAAAKRNAAINQAQRAESVQNAIGNLEHVIDANTAPACGFLCGVKQVVQLISNPLGLGGDCDDPGGEAEPSAPDIPFAAICGGEGDETPPTQNATEEEGSTSFPKDLIPEGETQNSWGNKIWGQSASGAEAAMGARTPEELRALGLTTEGAERLAEFYEQAAAAGRGGATAPARAALMREIAQQLGGDGG